MTLPALAVEVAFAGASTGSALHLDDAARGLLDTGTLAADDSTWTDITAYVRSGSIKRGSNRVDSPILRYDAGTATITLDNSDRRFDPTNLSGPYVSGGASQVTAMRAVRIRATWAGTTYDLWRGFADSWDISWDVNYSECILSATDAFKVLTGYDRAAVAGVGAGELTGARINRVLDSVNWGSTDRVIATGATTVQATTLEGDALAELQLVADTELGELYMDAAGRVVFRGRQAILTDTRSATAQATFGDGGGAELPHQELGLANDDTTLANRARVTRVGGAEQTTNDSTSQGVYMVRVFERSDLIMETDAEALNYAQWLLYVAKDPELRFDSLVFNPEKDNAALWPHALGRELGDRITVIRRPPGGGTITRDGFIRGITHDFDPGRWRTTWALQSASKYGSFLTLDNSTLGVLDSNALAY